MRVLITGGSGFFGRHMAWRLLKHGHIVCIYSRDEAKHARMRVEIDSPNIRWFVGDVRDLPRLQRAMNGCHAVIHAAALKRIEVGAYCPDEMVKTNIAGSMNVIEASAAAGVESVVALSSDKAYQPVSPYGQTKALMESLFLTANHSYGANGPRFTVTRYGNVAGSTGSVIPVWREQLKRSDTVTVTDPDCTRFWMRIDEACTLVQTAMDGLLYDRPYIPELPAFRLGDLAEAMGAKIKVTGLPSWEKRHESMSDAACSADARRMDVAELRSQIEHLGL